MNDLQTKHARYIRPFGIINYWINDNFVSTRDCDSTKEAQAIVKESKVKQQLYILEKFVGERQ